MPQLNLGQQGHVIGSQFFVCSCWLPLNSSSSRRSIHIIENRSKSRSASRSMVHLRQQRGVIILQSDEARTGQGGVGGCHYLLGPG